MDYKDLLKKLVCSTDNHECMLHLCTACPGKEEFNKVLTELFEDDDYELDDTVRYKQWVHTDRTTLITVENEVHEFIDVAANLFDNLRKHHYIMKGQSTYPKDLKENLQSNVAIVLLDFA